MRFVLRYLRFVHELKPKYWVMENVPRLFQSLPSRVPLSRLGVAGGGHLDIPVRRVLNAADYGVPQKRLRLISGKFPLPLATHTWGDDLGAFADLQSWVPVKNVLGLLPDPLGNPQPSRTVHDPCYDLAIPESDLTEHFMDTRLKPDEVEINRKSKTDHSWYGRMAFPDPIDRPARTVMATQTGVSRETLVLEGSHKGEEHYRRPTIRECASFQSFPITYQFWGSTAQTRYKVIGNAVPPLMAQALARALLRSEGLSVPRTPILTRTVGDRPTPVKLESQSATRRGHMYPEGRKFRDHVPGSKGQGVRVDFANVVFNATDENESVDVRWEARLIVGSGKTVTTVTASLDLALAQLADSLAGPDDRVRLSAFLSQLQAEAKRGLPDADGLQAAWSRRVVEPALTPLTVLSLIGRIVDRHFPIATFRGNSVTVSADLGKVGRREIPVRAAAQLLATAFFADAVMRGGRPRDLQAILEGPETARNSTKTRRRAILS
jgi:DNA (cytosine-5)-methyltransferase 1